MLGTSFQSGDGDVPEVLIESDGGVAMWVSMEDAKRNYQFCGKLGFSKTPVMSACEITNVSPVFMSYKGARNILIAVGDDCGTLFAIYQPNNDNMVYSMPLTTFYDLNSLLDEVAIGDKAIETLFDGIGFVTNEMSADKGEFPVRIFTFKKDDLIKVDS
ncbi:hypothetical protein [Photobacterium kishitanii]|uniref:hypothetical protein n=1 Tax=Photobacterium kishitanii TaxID=318456 RepID=UPI0011B27319|nr:hypothetical protein [Photobacterium kishitanii]